MEARAQRRIRWGAAALALLVIGALALLGIFHWLRPVVSVTQVVEGPVVEAFYATGTLVPEREYPIKSNVAGIIVDLRADKGQRIKKGEVLAVVKSDELALKLEQAKAELKEKTGRADEKTSPVLHELDAKIIVYGQLVEIAVPADSVVLLGQQLGTIRVQE